MTGCMLERISDYVFRLPAKEGTKFLPIVLLFVEFVDGCMKGGVVAILISINGKERRRVGTVIIWEFKKKVQVAYDTIGILPILVIGIRFHTTVSLHGCPVGSRVLVGFLMSMVNYRRIPDMG